MQSVPSLYRFITLRQPLTILTGPLRYFIAVDVCWIV
jgi:hypothetical protein